jgi:hypothetical protein
VKRAAGLSLGEVAPIPPGSDSYLTAEARARVEIDRQLQAAGWAVQDAGEVNLAASQAWGCASSFSSRRTAGPTTHSAKERHHTPPSTGS